jgi:dTDP-glucose 4,6-dehydratase
LETILITGGAGFLGSWFVRHWISNQQISKQPSRVVVLDKLTYAGNRASLAAVADPSRLVFRHGDIGDGSLVASLLAEFRPTSIVNFAAETHVDRSIDAPAPFMATNVVGTWQLLEQSLAHWRQLDGAGQGAFRFLHISTDEVFGPIDAGASANESSPYNPSSPYAASKAAADHFVRSYHRTYGLPTLIVHPSNCYGPFQFPEKLIPLMILNAFEGKPLPLYGDGQQQRDWLFCEDLCRAVALVLSRGEVGESYCVATGVEASNESLVRQIADHVDKFAAGLSHTPARNLMCHVADRPGHDVRYAMNAAKIRALGWSPDVALAGGLEETVRWYLANRVWATEVATNFDRTRRMGLPGEPLARG